MSVLISIKIGDKVILLSPHEAREVYTQLETLFGIDEKPGQLKPEPQPLYQPAPAYTHGVDICHVPTIKFPQYVTTC